jgi:GNAT superfamily N-acetyltransferase
MKIDTPVSMSVAVRPIRVEDAAAVAALSCQLGYPTTGAMVRYRFGSIADRPDAGVFVAQDATDRVIGWVHVYGTHLLESEPHAEIGALVVAEEARGHGVGRTLVTTAEAWAERHGYGTVRVRSNVARVQARGFYEHLGYGYIKTQNNFRKLLKASESSDSKGQQAT